MVRAGRTAGCAALPSGFGTKFIEASTAYELGGTARIRFEETGVRCTMQIKLETEEAAAKAAR